MKDEDAATLKVKWHEDGGVVTMGVSGRIDTATAGELAVELTAARRGLVLDLAAVTFVGSAGVRVLDQLRGAALAAFPIELRNLGPDARRMLETAGLLGQFDGDVAAARAQQREIDWEVSQSRADLRADRAEQREEDLRLRELAVGRRDRRLAERVARADQRDAADRRDVTADRRDAAADRRDAAAAERDRLADLRDRIADQREIDAELDRRPPCG